MKVISSARQAALRTLFILISMPAATWAGVKIDPVVIIGQTLSINIISLITYKTNHTND